MADKRDNLMTPQKRTHQLIAQRSALVKSNQRRSELQHRINGFEKRYGIKSHSVHAAINRGEIKETQEVCRWIMDYDLLKRTKAGRSR